MWGNNKMFGYLNKFLYLFSGNLRALFALVFLFLLTSILEAFGIGMVGGFLKLAESPQSTINRNSLLRHLYLSLEFENEKKFVLAIGLLIILIFIFKSIFFLASQYFTFKITLEQRRILQDKFFEAYSSAPYELHLSRSSSDLVNKVVVETSRFIYTFANPFLIVISQFFVLATLILLLIKTDLNLLVGVLISLLPVCILFLVLSRKIRDWGKLFTSSNEGIAYLVNHALAGVKEIRVLGCEDYFNFKMRNSTKQLARSETLFYTIQAIPRSLIETLLVICIISFLCLSLLFVEQEFQEVLASVGVFAIAGMRIVPAASLLITSLSAMRNSTHTVDLLYLDLKEVEGVSRSSSLNVNQNCDVVGQHSSRINPITSIRFEQQIQIQNLTYRYPGESSLTIDHVNILIKKGQSIGLIGKSGAGKTTLVDLLLGLLKAESGDIKVDGHSIYENLDSWRKNIGYIPQNIFLLDDTIKRNVALGVPDGLIDYDRLSRAIHLAQLEEVLLQMPDGINTQIGERGLRLSGGQRQRIGIARALYHEREILVLDEATSALDNETERLVNTAIESLAGLKTLVVIAHRLTTIEHCDCIYMLDKGRVIRSGLYEEVVHSVQ